MTKCCVNQIGNLDIIDEELAIIYGILLGDGCLSRGRKAYFISISGNIWDDIEFFNKIQPIISRMRGKITKYYFKQTQGKIEYNFSDKFLFFQLCKLGFPVGKKGSNLKIPKMFSGKLMKNIIQGYFATDGSLVIANNNGILYPRLEIKSISSLLLNEVLQFLASSGLKGNIYQNNNVKGGQAIFRLQYNGLHNLNKFRNLIGFYNPKHEKKFMKYIKSADDGI